MTEYRCEAGVDVDYSGFAPVVKLCGKPAKLYGIAALCEDCAAVILSRDKPEQPRDSGE